MCNVLDIKNYDDYIYYHSINVAMMSVSPERITE